MIEAVPQPPALDDIITDLQRIIDANETTNLLVRQTSPQLSEALLLHLCDIDALVRTLQVKLSQLSRR